MKTKITIPTIIENAKFDIYVSFIVNFLSIIISLLFLQKTNQLFFAICKSNLNFSYYQ